MITKQVNAVRVV